MNNLNDQIADPIVGTVVRWNNLSVDVKVKGKKRRILNNVSGEINNLETVSILGPSGSGKSTLLNAIVGKLNYEGSVRFFSKKNKKITFAFVPQFDELAAFLTVEENMLFSSKLKNAPNIDHLKETELILKELNLWNSRNHYASKCSGGERKRLSVALEMISKPSILILDEATTGLDSFSSYKLINYSKKINQNTTFIVSIHQPNLELFQLFDRCYILTEGRCIYNGHPNRIVEHLKNNFGFQCPMFTNPADFILDIANNVKTLNGVDLINRLAAYEQNSDEKNNRISHLEEVYRSSFNQERDFFRESFQISKRQLTSILRDLLQFGFRTITFTLIPVITGLVMKQPYGIESGCKLLILNSTHVLDESKFTFFDRRLIGLRNVQEISINLMFIFFIALVPSILIFSNFINLMKKEYFNSYYNLSSCYCAMIITNVILSPIYSIANTVAFFYFSSAPIDLNRFGIFFLIVFLNINLGDLVGLFLSICFPGEKKKLSAVIWGTSIALVLHVFSGFVLNLELMNEFMKVFHKFLFCHHTCAAVIKTIYKNRCKNTDFHIFGFDTVANFVQYYNTLTKSNLTDLKDAPVKYKSALKEYQWDKEQMMNWIQDSNDLENEDFTKLEHFWNKTESYIFDDLKLDSWSITGNFLNIMINLFCIIAICYLMLILKFRK